MARATKKNRNEPTAQNKSIKALNSLQRALILVGKIASSFQILLKPLLYATYLKIWRFRVRFNKKLKIILFDLFAKKLPAHKKSVRVYPPPTRTQLLNKLNSKFLTIKSIFPRPKPRVKFALSFFAIIFIIVPSVALSAITKDLPSPQELTTRSIEVSTNIYDRNGELLYRIYKDKNRSLATLDEIPIQVRLSTLAAEDAEFYDHPGFSVRGIFRAIVRNFKEGELTGGSTITQQLVKNTLLSPEKTYIRKIREVVLAVQVERAFEKDEILEMYLNEVGYGGTAYGIKTAARTYFDKEVSGLTLAESAFLAGLPKSPTTFSPHGPTPELGLARQLDVLRLMQINKYITPDQRSIAEQQKLKFADATTNIKAPHFVMFVRRALEEKYGKELVEQGGLDVKTTLDLDIQKLAEQVVKEEVEKLNNLNVTNGAVVVLNPKTGEILAMVGSKDYFDTKSDGNVNVTTSLRQPGSSIKIINYAYALSNSFTAASILEDTPTTFHVEGQEPYTPSNYDGKFRGNLTLRSAFAESRNVPAVKVLSTYGTINMINLGRDMGITAWDNPSDYGLSLTLGGGDVKLIDLAQIYATVANYGMRPELTPVNKITNFEGKVLEENHQPNQPQVLEPQVAYLLIDILKDNIARSPAFGSSSQLVIPGHDEVAVKTGTSNNLRDNLTIGFNQDYLVAAWVGNNDNSQMDRIASGLTGASTIWNNIMTALLSRNESKIWDVPEGLVQLPICPYTGTLACTGCPIKMEWFLVRNRPETACSSDWFENKPSSAGASARQGGEENILPTDIFYREIINSENVIPTKKPKVSPRGRILPDAAKSER